MIRGIIFVIAGAALSVLAMKPAAAQQPTGGAWRFVVSGDSRNCGDVVMPGIAETAKKNQAAFYWHLGDLRAIYSFDEDIQHQPDPNISRNRYRLRITKALRGPTSSTARLRLSDRFLSLWALGITRRFRP